MSKRARPSSDVESPSLVGDTIVVIARFLCIQEEGKSDANHIVSMTNNLHRMRQLCRLYRDAIDSSDTLWQLVLSFTRRATIQPPSCMPKSIEKIRAFVPLDAAEYRLRIMLTFHTMVNDYGCIIDARNREQLDYNRVVLQRYRHSEKKRGFIERKQKWYNSVLRDYKRTIKKMDSLCK